MPFLPQFVAYSVSAISRPFAVQLEFPSQSEVLAALDRLKVQYPQAQLLMLSEYTFSHPIPQRIRDWCRDNNRYLIAGGKHPAPNGQFYNTAFVVDPDGQIIFRQAKCVPIQFFKDGLPAPGQSLWHSPWGKIGLCVCYDLSASIMLAHPARLPLDRLLAPGALILTFGFLVALPILQRRVRKVHTINTAERAYDLAASMTV